MTTEFNTREYQFSHGREPRGRGTWASKRYPLFATHARRARNNNLSAARTARANGYSLAHVQCAVRAAKHAHRVFMELRRKGV